MQNSSIEFASFLCDVVPALLDGLAKPLCGWSKTDSWTFLNNNGTLPELEADLNTATSEDTGFSIASQALQADSDPQICLLTTSSFKCCGFGSIPKLSCHVTTASLHSFISFISGSSMPFLDQRRPPPTPSPSAHSRGVASETSAGLDLNKRAILVLTRL